MFVKRNVFQDRLYCPFQEGLLQLKEKNVAARQRIAELYRQVAQRKHLEYMYCIILVS